MEMENEKSKGALKKLDYKAEQLYFQRSQLEISNASSVAFITKEAYDQEAGIAEQAIAENNEYIQSRMVLRDEIARDAIRQQLRALVVVVHDLGAARVVLGHQARSHLVVHPGMILRDSSERAVMPPVRTTVAHMRRRGAVVGDQHRHRGRRHAAQLNRRLAVKPARHP